MTARPFSFSPSQFWEGNDGSWSTFALRIGTPPQTFRVLPSTTGQETWVPIPEACPESNSTFSPADCARSRGATNQPFHPNSSSTWKELGIYDLVLESELGYGGNGLFGLDKVGLQISNSGGVELEGQVVAGIAESDFWLGNFGLGPKPVNFSGLEYPVASYLQSLKDNGKIPSLSWGYTAGASYKTPSVFGSLTLGGYDESRFIPSDLNYPFDADDSKPLSISIESITTTDSLEGRTTLLNDSQTTYASIDSTVPHLWLPKKVCDRFEKAFGLSYDPNTDLYLSTLSTRDILEQMNASITIGIGLNMDPAQRTNIVLPYKAFDLQVSYPVYSNKTYYFPIRRAANETQYRLGRTFLQEAYLIADYERSQFSVHQAKFDDKLSQSIIPIQSTGSQLNGTNATDPTGFQSNSSNALSKGAIAGIAIGAWSALLLLVVSLLFIYRRRKRRTAELLEGNHEQKVDQGIVEVEAGTKTLPELHGAPLFEVYEPPSELHGIDKSPALLSDDSKALIAEMPAADMDEQDDLKGRT